VGEKHDNKVKGLVGSERLEMMKTIWHQLCAKLL